MNVYTSYIQVHFTLLSAIVYSVGRNESSFSEESGTGAIIGQGCSYVSEAGYLFKLLAVHSYVFIGVVCAVCNYLRRLRVELHPVLFLFFQKVY